MLVGMAARAWMVGVSAALLLVTACGEPGSGGVTTAPGSSPPSSASLSPSATPGLSAADGTRYAACPDGTCPAVARYALDDSRSDIAASACAPGVPPPPPKPVAGELAIQLAGWTADGAAVIRLATG